MMPTNNAPSNDDDNKTSDHDELVAQIVDKLKDATDDDLKKVAEALNMGKDENAEPAESDIPKVVKPAAPVVDTSLLTGPRSDLKGFLMKKAQDNSDGM